MNWLKRLFGKTEQNTSQTFSPGTEREFAGMLFCWIPPGKFMMGSPKNEWPRFNNEDRHRVTISKGFWLGKYPVTQAKWQVVMGNNPSFYKGDGRRPVEEVSWDDCQEFIRQLNTQSPGTFRLSTEAEWEYACRAGTTKRFYWGDDRNNLQISYYAWYNDNSGDKTHPVGQKRPNAWGLHDMIGNVAEWCQDWYGDYPSGAVIDPTGPTSGSSRVHRGGSWLVHSIHCRSAYRNGSKPGYAGDVGFRLAINREAIHEWLEAEAEAVWVIEETYPTAK